MKFFFVIVLSFLVVGISVDSSLAHDQHHHKNAEDLDKTRPQALKDLSIYQLDSPWTDQNGHQIKLKDFQGRPIVLAMVYTSCQAACPVIVSDIQRIASSLPQAVREKTQFALFTLDPDRDTSAQLKKFAEAHSLDQKSWMLLTASAGTVRELAAVLGIKYRKDPDGEFSHSNVITILDPDGVIRHQQVGLRQDPQASVRIISDFFIKKSK